jgi:ABC-type multidrug transport system fused ATPase/permease subunit
MLLDILLIFIKQHPWLIFVNTLLMVFVPINEVLLPYLYGKMVTDIITDKMLLVLTILIITLIVTQLGFLFRDKLNEIFIPKLESFIKTEVVDLVLKKYNTSFDNLTTGDIIYRMTKIPDIIIYWFQWMNDFIIPYVFVFISATIYFFKFDSVSALIFVIFLIILTAVFLITPKVCLKHAKINDTVISNIHEKVEDIIHNMSSIYSANTKKQELEKLRLSTYDYKQMFAKTAGCSRNFKMIMVPITTILVLFFILRSKYLIDSKVITHKKFVPMFVVLTSLLGSVFWIIDIMRLSVFDLGCLTNMDKLLEVLPEIPRQRFNVRPPPDSIGLKNIMFKYDNNSILNNFSIEFKLNKSTALVGPIGSGKSTILKLLLGFYVPEKGDAYMLNKWYSELDINYIRNNIGYVPQNPVLFNNTVMYNIMYGNQIDRQTIKDFVFKIGIMPSFLDREVGKNGMNLSGGQRQLVWCLRVFFKNPKILLFDEPTASMDLETKNVLLYLIKLLLKDRTVIIITHDDYLLKIVDYQITI